MTFKRGFVVLRLTKKSAVIHLHLDSVLVFEGNGVTLRLDLRGKRGKLTSLIISADKQKINRWPRIV